jgi:hypothetical protein
MIRKPSTSMSQNENQVAMKTLLALLISTTIASAQFRVPDADGEQQDSPSSFWYHNGSSMYLVASGKKREFYYKEPRPEMIEAGARRGSLLFTGRSAGGRYVGTAYIYNPRCGRIGYPVSGPILDRYQRVSLRGSAPLMSLDCQVKGHIADNLEFTLLKPGETAPPLAIGTPYVGTPVGGRLAGAAVKATFSNVDADKDFAGGIKRFYNTAPYQIRDVIGKADITTTGDWSGLERVIGKGPTDRLSRLTFPETNVFGSQGITLLNSLSKPDTANWGNRNNAREPIKMVFFESQFMAGDGLMAEEDQRRMVLHHMFLAVDARTGLAESEAFLNAFRRDANAEAAAAIDKSNQTTTLYSVIASNPREAFAEIGAWLLQPNDLPNDPPTPEGETDPDKLFADFFSNSISLVQQILKGVGIRTALPPHAGAAAPASPAPSLTLPWPGGG